MLSRLLSRWLSASPGALVRLSIDGAEYASAYTNNAASCTNVAWSLSGATGALLDRGSGVSASFTVTEDATFRWIFKSAVASTHIDGVPVAWLRKSGLGLNPEVPMTGANLRKLGYLLGDMFDAGLDPAVDEPFAITGIRILDDEAGVVQTIWTSDWPVDETHGFYRVEVDSRR